MTTQFIDALRHGFDEARNAVELELHGPIGSMAASGGDAGFRAGHVLLRQAATGADPAYHPATVDDAGISVKGLTVPEFEVDEEDWEDYIIEVTP